MPSMTIITLLAATLFSTPDGPVLAFAAPRIVRLESGTHSLRSADFDADGLQDIAVVNNAKARIDLLLQRKEGTFTAPDPEGRNVPADDPLFEKRSLLTEKRVSSMAVGDFDSDGLADVAFYGDPKSLVVAYQGEGGSFDRRREYDVRDGSAGSRALDAGDLNGDGKADLVLLAETDIVLFVQGEGGLGEPQRIASALKDVAFVRIADVGGDGRADLVLVSGDDPRPIRVRHQREDGTIGPELAFRSPTIRSLATAPRMNDASAGSALVVVPQASGLLRELRFEIEAEPEGGIVLGRPRLFPFGGVKGPKRRSLATGDVDGDGRVDVVATDPAAAQVLLYRQTAKGELSGPAAFPSYREATSVRIADVDGDGIGDAVLSSPDEKSVGYMKWESGRLTFPKPIDVGGTPMALDAADVDGDKRSDVVVALKQDKATRLTIVFGGSSPERVDVPLEGAGEVSGVRVADLDGDGIRDLVVFFPADPVRVLHGLGSRGFAEIPANVLLKETSVKDLTVASAAIDDLDGDGRDELLFASKNTARAVRLREGGHLAVIDQLNGRTNANFSGVVAADVDGDGKPEAIAYDEESKSLVILRRGPQGVFDTARTLETGAFDFAGLLTADLTGDGREDIVLVGTEKFGVVPSSVPDFVIAEGTPYESSERNAVLTNILSADVGGPPGAEIVALDVRNYRVEILGRGEGDAWKRLYSWKAFETKTFEAEGRGGEEPHGSCVADVTGDGRMDLVLLVHDRVLVYPGVPAGM